MIKNNFDRDIFLGGVANLFIVSAFFIRNIILVRKASISSDLDAFLLGTSLVQLCVFSILKMYLNGVQPNIAKYKSKFTFLSIIFGLIILIFLHIFFYIFHTYIIELFTGNQVIELLINRFIFDLILLSFLQSLFIFFNGIINIVINISLSLKLEISSNVFLLFLLFFAENIEDIYFSYIVNYLIILIITLVALIRNFKLEFNYSKIWLNIVFKNFTNYFLSFLVSIPTSWYEKKTLSSFNTGSITIFNLITKVISPINNILINPSVLLATFSKNNFIENKKILNKFLLACFVFLTFLTSTLIFLSGLFKSLISKILLISLDDSSIIISTFQIMTLSIFPSVVYTGFQKFLSAINKSNIILKINIVSSIQLILLYFFLKRFDIYGFISALVINSYLSTFYVFVFFINKFDFKISVIFGKSHKNIKIIIFLSIIFLLLKFIWFNKSDLLTTTEIISYLLLLCSYLLSFKSLRNIFKY
jgi:hypothetical protein